VEKAATWRGCSGVEERAVTWRLENVKRERDEANVTKRFVFVFLIFLIN
jgi:hypothetical protein